MKSIRLLVIALSLGLGWLGAVPSVRAEESEKSAASETKSEEGAKTDSHAAAAGHADETDLSHANATSQLNSPAELRFELTIATMVVFLLLLLLLGKFAWGPIAQGLDSREKHIAGMIADAERNSKEAQKRLQELEARLAAQAEEAREALSAARREGEQIKEKIVGEAQAAAQAEKERALVEIRNAKNLALREIAQKSVNTAVDLARNLIHREVRPEDHTQLINDSLNQFSNSN